MKIRNAALPMMLATLAPLHSHAQEPIEGVHFEQLKVPYGVGDNALIGVFSPACPHCYRLEEPLAEWLEERDLDLVRVPFFHEDRWVDAGRVVLSMQSTGYDDERLIAGLFDAIHEEDVDPDDPEAILETLPLDAGEREEILDAMSSSEVRAREGEIRAWLEENRIVVVPTVVLSDRYLSDPARARGNDNLLLLLDFLDTRDQ